MKTLLKLFAGIVIIILAGIIGSMASCTTTKLDKEIHKEETTLDSSNTTKIDSTNKTTIIEEVDTTAIIPADTSKGSIPITFFTDTADTSTIIFENTAVVLKIKKKKGKVDYEVIRKEQKVHFKYNRKTTSYTRLKKGSTTEVKKTSKTVDKSLHKTITSLPWWIWLILIIGILVGLYFLMRWINRKFHLNIPGF